MTDRNFKVCLVKGTSPEIKQVSDFRTLFNFMLTDKELKQKAAKLAKLSKTDTAKYNKEKLWQPGFIIGEFTRRAADACVNYEPVLGFDIDHIKDDEYKTVFEKLTKWPFTFVAMPSISKEGIRVLLYSTSTKDRHEDYYKFAARQISALTSIPTKSAIRDKFKDLGYNKDEINKFLKENAHVDDAVKDISRFWYYSGLEKNEVYVNKESAILTYKEQINSEANTGQTQNNKPGEYPYTFTESDKVAYIVEIIEQNRIDITQGVADWFKLGLGLYDQFGMHGEDYFLRVSQFHPDYDRAACVREWQRVVNKYQPGKVSIGTFYKWCQDYGVGIDYNELVEKYKDKFAQKQVEVKQQKKEAAKKAGHFQEDLERCIIATCIHYPGLIDSIFDASPHFGNSCFYDETAKMIFSVIESLRISSMPVTELTIRQKLGFKDCDPYKVISIFDKELADSGSLLTNVKMCFEVYLKRKAHEIGQQIINDVSQKDINIYDYSEEISNKLSTLTDTGVDKTELDALALAKQAQDHYDAIVKARKEKGAALVGVPTGLTCEDEYTNGYRPGKLIVLAGRPGMGKTAKALKTVMVNAKQGYPVGVFSLEMPSLELTNRLVSMYNQVRLKRIIDAELMADEQQRYFMGLSEVSNWPLIIDDASGVSYQYIARKAKKWKRKNDIQLLVIDYLQLMRLPKGNQNDAAKWGDITKNLKALAKELDIPIILLSQLNRAVETRGGSKRPQLSDLRESGAIEQDADQVLFMYRPEYYQILEDEEGQSLKGIVEIIYGKNRDGKPETLKAFFNAEMIDITDIGSNYSASKAETRESELIPIIKPKNRNDDDEIPF